MQYAIASHNNNKEQKPSITNLQAIPLDLFFTVVTRHCPVRTLFFQMLFEIFLFQLLSTLLGATYINKSTLFQMILKDKRAIEYV